MYWVFYTGTGPVQKTCTVTTVRHLIIIDRCHLQKYTWISQICHLTQWMNPAWKIMYLHQWLFVCKWISLKCITHTNTKLYVRLQDENKRFIFRGLDPLLCSGFSERMTARPWPLLAFVWGVGLLLRPQAASSCPSVGQCENGVRQSDDGYSVETETCVFFAV